MNQNNTEQHSTVSNQTGSIVRDKKRRGCLSTLALMLLTVIISVAVTVWILTAYIFPKQFEPVSLSSKEQVILNQKLQRFEGISNSKGSRELSESAEALAPIPYSETGADRNLSLSERELNAILAKNTDLADKLAIDLSDGLISARLRIPMDPDFPFFGGKLLKARAGVAVEYSGERPSVVLKGVSIMGVPVPNAWMGGLKNIDLVEEFGQDEGFWQSFSAGVANVKVVEGNLELVLKE